jgi:hypothetical protein
VLPGHPGPDPGVLGALRQPALWLADTPQPRPEGIRGEFRVVEGPHGYERPMLEAAMDFLGAGAPPETLPISRPEDLRSTDLGAAALADLVRAWPPVPAFAAWPAVPFTLDCPPGAPRVLLAGDPPEREGCRVTVPEEEGLVDACIAQGKVAADRYASALRSAARQAGTDVVVARGPWVIAARRSGLRVEEVDAPTGPPADGPAWVHVRGVWGTER